MHCQSYANQRIPTWRGVCVIKFTIDIPRGHGTIKGLLSEGVIIGGEVAVLG